MTLFCAPEPRTFGSDGNTLDLVQRELVTRTVVEFRGARALVRRDRLRVLDRPAVLEVGRDAGRSEGLAAGVSVQACCLRAPVDDPQRIVPRQRPLGELSRARARRAEEGSLLVGLDAGRVEVASVYASALW